MVRADQTIASSDFDYPKNDASATAQVTFPGSTVIPASTSSSSAAIRTVDVEVGEAESLLNVRFRTSKEGARYFVASVQQSLVRTGTVSGSPAGYSMFIFASHVSGNTVRFTVIVTNPYSSPLTTASGNEVFDILVRTFKAPRFA